MGVKAAKFARVVQLHCELTIPPGGLYADGVNHGMMSGSESLLRRAFFISIVLAAAAPVSRGQDALRKSLAGEEAAEAQRTAYENKFYNLKLGPVEFTFAPSVRGAWNDNITASENGESDFYIGPNLMAAGIWPVTDKNTINFSVGLGYQKYIEHDELDRFTVTPGTQVSFNFFVKDFRINLHDRMSYSLDPIDVGSVSGTSEYGGLDNTAGVLVDWDLNQVVVTAGYDHHNFISDAEASDSESRATEMFNLSTSVELNPALKTGPEMSYAITDYEERFHNNNRNVSVGWFADWKASDYLSLRPRGGYVHYAFDEGGAIGNTPDLSSFYASVSITHRVNEFMSHSLNGGHEVQSGVNSDALRQYFARYNAQWNIIRNVSLSGSAFYENGSDTDAATAEDYDRIGFSVGAGYSLTRNLVAFLGYQFTVKDSSRPGRDYTQNLVNLTLSYRFLPKLP
jgi:hypothetical protein